MRIVFCGSGDFGIPTLRLLASGAAEVVGVITQPARPAGRGGQLRPTPLGEAAAELGLPVRAAEDVNAPQVVSEMAASSADVMVVADFGQFVRRSARQTVRLAAVNLHGSLLPELRGAAPVNWAIIRGYRQTGVTVFHLVERMDAGRIILRRATPLGAEERVDELRARLANLGAEAVLEALALIQSGNAPGDEQDESKVTLAPRLTKADGAIDWRADADAIRNRIHGVWPWPGAHTRLALGAGKELDVILARARASAAPAGTEPGELAGDLTVATGAGGIEILELKPAGRRLMAWRDFVNGYRVAAGARFVPASHD